MINKTLLFTILFISCNINKQEKKTLEDYPLIIKTFNQSEISDLKKVLSFFDNEMRIEFKSKSIQKNYSSFYKKSLKELDSGRIYVGFTFKKQAKLIEELKETTFNGIWDVGKSFTEKDTINVINLKVKGVYAKFLKELGKENKAIKRYIDDLVFNYDITPEQSYFFINNYDSLDITDERVRLMIAIHYLTLNNIYGEKE